MKKSIDPFLLLIVLLGGVSLFADITYEGARGLNGQFLESLSAKAWVVGVAVGGGELLGYALRLLSGYLVDRTGLFWVFLFVGYGLNLLSVPALGFVTVWEWAVLWIVLERIGKAIRTPARDILLSTAGEKVGVGWAFSVHEALDQVGGMVGPFFLAGVLSYFSFSDLSTTYRFGYRSLFFPALVALLLLVFVFHLFRKVFPSGSVLTTKTPKGGVSIPSQGGSFPLFLVGSSLLAFGWVDFPLIGYHLQREGVFPPAVLPLLYGMVMGVDGVVALLLGKLYDRFGKWVLLSGVFLSIPVPVLLFFGSPSFVLAGLFLWGAGLGIQESLLKALIVPMVPKERRGTAFGVFYLFYGGSWFFGSALLGYLYDRALPWMVFVAVLSSTLSFVWFFGVRRRVWGR